MDEKEAIRFVRDSLAEKQTRAEITRKFQEKGYKLEYINAIIAKAKRPKKLMINLSIIFLLLISLTLFVSSIYLFKQKASLENPLSNYVININLANHSTNLTEDEVEEIEITPEFISYILNELGAWKLHKSPLNLEKPIINFEISELEFYSTVDKKIETLAGTNNNADLKFIFEKRQIIEAILSENPEEYIREKFKSGEAKIETLTDDKELFIKGYLSLYNSLSE